jgi:hypothetical protein
MFDTHGSGSKLIDIRTHEEYQQIASKVGYGTRSVLYNYIEQYKNQKDDILRWVVVVPEFCLQN